MKHEHGQRDADPQPVAEGGLSQLGAPVEVPLGRVRLDGRHLKREPVERPHHEAAEHGQRSEAGEQESDALGHRLHAPAQAHGQQVPPQKPLPAIHAEDVGDRAVQPVEAADALPRVALMPDGKVRSPADKKGKVRHRHVVRADDEPFARAERAHRQKQASRARHHDPVAAVVSPNVAPAGRVGDFRGHAPSNAVRDCASDWHGEHPCQCNRGNQHPGGPTVSARRNAAPLHGAARRARRDHLSGRQPE
mmetsp:Transcript_247/g.753  ORF Transcript_247/g.753 Transcript_247/m.753 type:complete len:249 (+) Transcript_247:2154-2900(+)